MSRTLTLVALIVVLAGCRDSDSASSETTETTTTVEATQTTTETTGTIANPKVLVCLKLAGLSDVEASEVDTWRGLHHGPSYAIVVHKLATSAKAPTVVAGAYALTGPFKVAAQGTGLPNSGLDADFLVQEVADCLGD